MTVHIRRMLEIPVITLHALPLLPVESSAEELERECNRIREEARGRRNVSERGKRATDAKGDGETAQDNMVGPDDDSLFDARTPLNIPPPRNTIHFPANIYRLPKTLLSSYHSFLSYAEKSHKDT